MKSLRIINYILAAACLAALSGSAFAQNLISNGSFENENAAVVGTGYGRLGTDPSPTGWTYAASKLQSVSYVDSNSYSGRPNDPSLGNTIINAADGQWYVSFDPSGGPPVSQSDYDSLSQSVQTAANTTYVVTYSLYLLGGTGQSGSGDYFNITWDNSVVSGSQITDNETSTQGWHTYQITIQGDGSAHSIGFNGFSNTHSVNVDNLSMVAQSVPEPSSFAALGIGLVGFFIKRRK